MSEQYDIDEKYSLSIYHFNIQYVAGNVKTYHHLHKQSMRPFLTFFERHPEWRVSCELQGHYLKFMQKFYPEDLKRLQALNAREQIELVSVHYSDQIYMAYPLRDLEESIKINNEIFEELDLVRSPVWFGQENFFGQGIAERIMPHFGYETALLNNHFVWHHDHDALRKAPYWLFYGHSDDKVNYLVSSGQGYEDPSRSIRISQRFSYWDDAELAFGSTPYAPFLAKPYEQYLKHLWKYKNLEKEGYKIVRVQDYIKRVKDLNLPPKKGPFLTDGTWNIRYYGGVYLWMGSYRFPWERDARLRSLTYRVRSKLLATEKLVEWGIKNGYPKPSHLKYLLRMAWKHMLLAEVSDSTGQQPAPIEVHYTYAECDATLSYLNQIIKEIKSQIQVEGKFFDTAEGRFCDERCHYEDIDSTVPFSKLKAFFPRVPFLIRTKKKDRFVKVYRVNDEFGHDDRHFILELKFHTRYTPLFKRIAAFFRDGEKRPDFARFFDERFGNYAGIYFPMWESKIIYSPAMMEDTLVSFEAKEFDFKRTWLPLPNGLIGIGNDTYIIKHNAFRHTHIAATLIFESEQPYVAFLVLNPYGGAYYHWRYSIFRGSQEEALKIANKLNVFPTERI